MLKKERDGSVVKSLPPSLISLILKSHMVRILPHPKHTVCVKRKRKRKKERKQEIYQMTGHRGLAVRLCDRSSVVASV